MRKTRIIAALVAGLLLTVSGCAVPAATAAPTPVPVPAPVSIIPAPALVPASIIPAPALVPASIIPAPALAPGEWNIIAGPTKYIVEVTPASGQAGFLLSQLQIYPQPVAVGDNVTVSVVVTNTGVQPAAYTVTLEFDGAVITTQDVTIGGGNSTKIELNSMAQYGECNGEFKVVAGDLTANLKVLF
jgi:hypothetical protein